MSKAPILFSLILLSVIISLPLSFAEDDQLREKAGEAIAIAGEKAGEVIVETGEKAGEVIVETGEKAEVIVETGEVIVETGEKAAEKGTIIGEVIVEKSSEGLNEINEKSGGCLIATAAYGSEFAPQVQLLREIRDHTLLSTSSGTTFITGFNQLYYLFSPTIANFERENASFQELVRLFITPLMAILSIMTLAEEGSEVEVLGFGVLAIAANLGIYVVIPITLGFKINKYLKVRRQLIHQ